MDRRLLARIASFFARPPHKPAPAPGPPSDPAEVARAARLLQVRARRQAAGPFAGAWSSAFRGSGVEFEESRPYVPGDDVRSLDWNATARAGEPFVKRFREERDQTVVVLLDLSGSMAFGSGEHTKASAAARAAALVAAAAGQAGDRVGLLAFGAGVRAEVPPGRGPGHLAALVQEASRASSAPAAGATDVGAALERASRLARRRAVLFLLSDLRDDRLFAGPGAGSAALAAAGRRHDLVAALVSDPREESLPAAGPVRVTDPERPGRTFLLGTGSGRVRELYTAAAAVRRRAVEKRLRDAGADVLHLSTREDPLQVLGRFFRQRAGSAGRPASGPGGTAGAAPAPRGLRAEPGRPGAGPARLGTGPSRLGTGLATLLVALLAACGADPGDTGRTLPPERPGAEASAPGPAAPVGLRGAVILEPPRVGVGQVVHGEIAVATPPEHRLPPPELPPVPGFWTLEVRPLGVDRGAGRWIHRIGVRLRAREVGTTAWPAMRLRVEGPRGEVRAVEIPERPLEVVSVREELPHRRGPFGYAAPPAPPGPLPLLLAAGAGALGTLALGGGVVLLRRRRAAARRAAALAPPAPLAAWKEAGEELDAAQEALATEPRAAAERAALALRRYTQRRWGATTRSATTPELERMRAPYGARSVWPRILALLRRLDAARFEPEPRDPEELAETVREARRLVQQTPPPQLPPETPEARK